MWVLLVQRPRSAHADAFIRFPAACCTPQGCTVAIGIETNSACAIVSRDAGSRVTVKGTSLRAKSVALWVSGLCWPLH